jgi:hypothetical protein
MRKTISLLLLSGVMALTLGACETMPLRTDLTNAKFWQRAETSSAIYQRGPKAQQMLHRDISRCTVEVRELKRLGGMRVATPADADVNGTIPDQKTPEGHLAAWDSPERDGYLLTEHTDYHDFETCMMTKGWERVEYLPYNISEQARDTYIETITGERRRTDTGENTNTPVDQGPYGNLNQ